VNTDDVSPVATVLEFDGVRAGYGATTVLRDVSFQVRAGQVVALLGPNGAGKTTVLRTASGIIRPTSGSVRLDNNDVSKHAPHRRTVAGLCLIPEGRGVFKSLTVRENLRLHVPAGGSRSDEAIDLAVTVFPALSGRMNVAAGHLSGGQQQMLSLARAYVTNPRVILLDEVSMGLAPRVVDEMFHALRILASTGTSMLIVEQYVTRAIAMADCVVLLNKGTITYDGAPSQLDEQAVLRGYLGVG
jgi:branched-chain amino acid transport system ATP-binding protein